MALPLSYLFVPGNRPDRFDKAMNSAAGAIILDLEDAVDATSKMAAREAVADWLGKTPRNERILVRINDATTPWFADDLALIRRAAVLGVMLPKAESAGQVETVVKAFGGVGFVVPLIESARGLRAVDAIAAAPGVQRLAFGSLDFAVDLGLSGELRGLIPPAIAMAVASRCAERAAPIAGVTAEIGNHDALARDLAWTRDIGFSAKLCIHPGQIDSVHKALAPDEREIAWARRVIAAAEAGSGVVQVDGRMVDRPVLLKAQSIIDRILS